MVAVLIARTLALRQGLKPLPDYGFYVKFQELFLTTIRLVIPIPIGVFLPTPQ